MADADVELVTINGDSGDFPVRRLRDAVRAVVHGENRQSAHVSITFLGPVAMRELNRQFLAHDWPTDVISFPLPQPDGSLSGDVYLCRAVAARQARDHGVKMRDEILRLVVHGTLHVFGWDHPDDGERVHSPMWQRQEHYLAAVR